MNRDIVQYAQACRRCEATLSQGKREATLHVRPKENRPFELVDADLKGHYQKLRMDMTTYLSRQIQPPSLLNYMQLPTNEVRIFARN